MTPADRAAGAAPNNAHEFSVSEISFALKRTVEETFGHVRVRGEITGYRGPHSSGHCYFGLKDDKARIDAVVWRGAFQKLRFKPEEGMEVIATGKLTTYPGSSKYQIVIEHLEPAGVGALMALLEERRKKLMAEGLFAQERKRPLPFLPEVIGVVTSPTGAVIRDILHRLQDRFPRHVIVWPVRVQGETSAGEVAAAIRGFNAMEKGGKLPRPDVLIVARGGGSIEDLWSFNEEAVVRAAAESDIPLISAVGHETDTTLIDFAADRRAPTPTAAAEMAVPVRGELVADIRDRATRLMRAETRLVERMRSELTGLSRGLPKLADLIALPRQRFDNAAERLRGALSRVTTVKRGELHKVGAPSLAPIRRNMAEARKRTVELAARAKQAETRHLGDLARRLDGQGKLLESYSYHGVLKRGYAVVRDAKGAPVRAAAGQKAGDALEIEFADGRLGAVVAPGTAAGGAAPQAPKKPAPKKDGGKQGTLL
ncbi:exodeoxyribonuclease VII large subunit [Parvibaculum sp.]|uniref:exodeoxyribonuclease VII large subunit n=1 Tax=Parvibaculum sp. TaxID=2024848 RepID=UPI000C5D4A33|nr:exodeoxyribonuclease VII large subunit [Parvibaculum sp.]MAU61989.1 exodeoxyribonuclease VII large subunit [Parvibaculum sp.]MBO6666881.1 exodeoxyribonuclease VII large subunit [Parvibaculum sp.]MBO6691914.1 exodeoxyribonuclease VII large subunit [Parvibaculum sp.]MBO6713502.1 exodeoxyribonuclease VII large subunit [Parvibaculum sp.]